MNRRISHMNINNWIQCEPDNFLVISGPCGAETRGQVLKTAGQLAKTGKVQVFRSGVWKPRTRPGGFEGAGSKALGWLKQVKEETGLKVIVEVATASHVEQCLESGIDMVWIGARTTSNPFSVQEIASALRGVDIPVLVKNPLNPDLNLWIGAIERIYTAGIRKIAAVHRGFFPVERTRFRNIPKWEIAIELKSKFHELPIICDPSHMAGDAALIEELSQKALDLNMNGLMIESHFDPATALCDAEQQVTPTQLLEILNRLKHRVQTSDDPKFQDILNEIRNQIDSIDTRMLELLGQRTQLSNKIGIEKFKRNISVLQLERWEEMQTQRLELAKKLGISESFVKNILQLVHKESIALQTDIMKQLKQGN